MVSRIDPWVKHVKFKEGILEYSHGEFKDQTLK